MVGEVAGAIVCRAHGSQAAGVFEQHRSGVSCWCRPVALATVNPVLLLRASGRGPIPMGECAQVVGIHGAIVLRDEESGSAIAWHGAAG